MPTRRVLLALTGLHIDGGIASVSRCVARAMDEWLREGRLERCDRVLLMEDPADPAPPPRRGEQRLSRGSQARFVAQLVSSVWRRRPDLVFFDHVGLGRALRIPLPGVRSRPYVVFTHGTELAPEALGTRQRVLDGAWRILTNSHFTARRLAGDHPQLAGRIVPVPLCIDPEKTRAWEAGGAAPSTAREPAVLIVGRLWSEERGKGHDALLEAWPGVRREHPEACLWVAGDGNDRPRLEARARELGVGDCVHFLGRVSEEELARRYRSARIFAMPSRQEGFGLVYAEAMWHGLPCVGSTADAATEVITDGETGVLVPYGDPEALAAALVGLLGDPERLDRMGESCARRARRDFGYPRFRDDLARALELEPQPD